MTGGSIAQAGTVFSPRPDALGEPEGWYLWNVCFREAQRRGLNFQDAENVASSVMECLARTARDGRPRRVGNLKAYVRAATRRQVVSHRRSERRRRDRTSLEDAPDPEAPSTDRFEPLDASDKFAQIWSKLTVPQQELLKMRFEDDLKWVEIAKKLGVSNGTIYQRWFRLRKRLRTLFGVD